MSNRRTALTSARGRTVAEAGATPKGQAWPQEGIGLRDEPDGARGWHKRTARRCGRRCAAPDGPDLDHGARHGGGWRNT
jgi:hypothetical protein